MSAESNAGPHQCRNEELRSEHSTTELAGPGTIAFFIQVILYFKVYLMTCPASPIILLPALVL